MDFFIYIGIMYIYKRAIYYARDLLMAVRYTAYRNIKLVSLSLKFIRFSRNATIYMIIL